MKFLNAMSVGFIPKKWERRQDANGEELARGYLFTLWEFLEGSSAQEAAEHFRARVRWPLHAAFSATELGRTLKRADWSVAQEGYLWQQYGERLFSLFDVGQPAQWEELRSFLREYYELLPDHPFIWRNLEVWGIPPWNVC